MSDGTLYGKWIYKLQMERNLQTCLLPQKQRGRKIPPSLPLNSLGSSSTDRLANQTKIFHNAKINIFCRLALEAFRVLPVNGRLQMQPPYERPSA